MKKKLVLLLSVVLVVCSMLCACGICRTCNDEGKILCTNSDCMDGDIRCDECNGTSKTNYDPCYLCDGDGWSYGTCPQCDGLGKIRNPITWEYFACGVCGGSLYKETCTRCKGDGGDWDNCTKCERGSLGTCQTCDGEIYIDCPDCEK